MTYEYATGTEGYPLPLCGKTAFNLDLEESINNLQFSSLRSIRKASFKPKMLLQ